MNRSFNLLGGLGLGAGLMYFCDPQLGRRRRVLVRDRAASLVGNTDDALCLFARDVSQRAYGVWAETRALLSGKEVSDPQLEGRVREAFPTASLVSAIRGANATIAAKSPNDLLSFATNGLAELVSDIIAQLMGAAIRRPRDALDGAPGDDC